MSKAVFAMDMPESCYQCPFGNDNFECDVIGRPLDVNQKIEKPGWCPLRHKPEKIHDDNGYDEYSDGYDAGWNACIDAIGGGNGAEAK